MQDSINSPNNAAAVCRGEYESRGLATGIILADGSLEVGSSATYHGASFVIGIYADGLRDLIANCPVVV